MVFESASPVNNRIIHKYIVLSCCSAVQNLTLAINQCSSRLWHSFRISNLLRDSHFECHIGSRFLGASCRQMIFILLSPSLGGLQCLVDICSDYANNYNLVLNVIKTICTVIGKLKFTISNVGDHIKTNQIFRSCAEKE